MTAELSEDVLGVSRADAELRKTRQPLRCHVQLGAHLRGHTFPPVVITLEKQRTPELHFPTFSWTHFTEVLLKVAELQTLFQLGAVTLPEIVERRLRLVQLTQQSEEEEEREEGGEMRGHSGTTSHLQRVSIHPFLLVPLHSRQVFQFVMSHIVFRVCLQRLVDTLQQACPLRQRHLQVLLEIELNRLL